ncbi:MAG: indolepyruvate oxidoreductase subunit beta family protein [Burkholderiaceae bacterium]|nr:indolepyruvate oxidoreductase subunit beta family protein [Burkholderiaceae bacterium]
MNGEARKWPIAIAVQALGGQGGGVLVDWIVDLAEHGGFVAQATSVAGVAQRTGATIYYIEMLPRSVLPADGRQAVLAQMPVPGEVDIVIASELMEAGRAVQRGFVTPDRTVVIASSHRNYSADEKTVPGNGIADATAVTEAVRAQARRLIEHDMQALAVRHASVISASLFGALAGSGELPFAQEAFEETVRRGGVGVEPSLRAFRAAAELARRPQQAAPQPDPMITPPSPLPQRAASAALQPLVDRIRRVFPEAAWAMLGAGLARVVEFQDAAYGEEYLDRMERVLEWARRCGNDAQAHALTAEAARQVAVAMAYDDIIRVADLKTRSERFERVRAEVGARAGDVVAIEEYFHPRLEELCSLLPARLGAWVESSPRLRAWLGPRLDRGRRVRSATVLGYLQLRALAQLRRRRRGTLRHRRERAHLEAWLARVEAASARDPALALEIVRCRRLVKGYSDTHARGTSRFDRMMAAADLLAGRPDAAAALARLREAALGDASGAKLQAHWSALGLPASG